MQRTAHLVPLIDVVNPDMQLELQGAVTLRGKTFYI